jgi:hypothetical protein
VHDALQFTKLYAAPENEERNQDLDGNVPPMAGAAHIAPRSVALAAMLVVSVCLLFHYIFIKTYLMSVSIHLAGALHEKQESDIFDVCLLNFRAT